MSLIGFFGYSQCPDRMSNNGIWIDKDTFDLYVKEYITSSDKWRKEDYIIIARMSNTIILYYDFEPFGCRMPNTYELFIDKATNSRIKKKLKAKMIREGVWYSEKYDIGLFGFFNNKNSNYYWIK